MEMNNNNNIYNHVLFKLQDYMFNENTLNNSIKYKNMNDDINKEKNIKNINTDKNNVNANKNNNGVNDKNKIKDKFFIPKQNDTLFWCFYIIKFGDINYELEDKNLLNEKKIKIDYVEKIRKNKIILKKYKFETLTNIENNLVNDKCINLSTFFSLCAIENIDIILLNEKKSFYYELSFGDSNNENFNIIYDISDIKKYGYSIDKLDTIMDYKKKYFKLDNINKPIKGMSSYKVEDLIDICNRLKINTIDIHTNKTKNKKELYESIVQYF